MTSSAYRLLDLMQLPYADTLRSSFPLRLLPLLNISIHTLRLLLCCIIAYQKLEKKYRRYTLAAIEFPIFRP